MKIRILYALSSVKDLSGVKALLLFIASLFLLVASSGGLVNAQALSQCDLDSIYKDTVWYQPCNEGNGPTSLFSCDVTVSANLSGNGLAQKAFNYFVAKGLTPVQSAGLIGNFMQESGVNPRLNNPSGESDFPNSSHVAYGIAQWLGGRQDALVQKAKSAGTIAGDLGLQLDYVWYELSNTESAAGNDLKKQTTVHDAAISVFSQYERPGDSTGETRAGYAQQAYDLFASKSTGGTIGVPTSTSGCASTGPGQNTKYINGFTVYSQYDSAWKDLAYSSSTIGDSGCGPSAMAMIITALTGQQITPVQTANYAASQGLYIPGAGSSWSIAPVLAAHWGLDATPIGANIDKITATLQTGGLVIVSGQGPIPFTTGGHYIVIRGVTADGKWLIGDSAHNDTSDKAWEPSQLISFTNDGSVYAITK